MRFYVYLHKTADTGRVFYVGKGAEIANNTKRYLSTGHRNPHWHNIVNKHGFTYEIKSFFDNEKDALDYEIRLIAYYREIGFDLANKTDGGEGTIGHVQSKQLREWRSNFMKGNTFAKDHKKTDEQKKAHSLFMKGNTFAKRITPEERARNFRSKPVICIESNKSFLNIAMAVEWLKDDLKISANHSAISQCCSGKKKSAYGFKWQYI